MKLKHFLEVISNYFQTQWPKFSIWVKLRYALVLPANILMLAWILTYNGVIALIAIPVFAIFSVNELKIHHIRADTDPGYPRMRLMPYFGVVISSVLTGILLSMIGGYYIFAVLIVACAVLYDRLRKFSPDVESFKSQVFEAESKNQIVATSLIPCVIPVLFTVWPAYVVFVGTQNLLWSVSAVIIILSLYLIFMLEEAYPYFWILQNIKRIVPHYFGNGRFVYKDNEDNDNDMTN